MSEAGSYNPTINPFNLLETIKGIFSKKEINSFFTVSISSIRFGEFDHAKEKHFKKYKDAFEYYQESIKHHKDEKYYKDIKETANESGIKFEASDIGEKWEYLIELFEQKLK